MSCTLGGTGVCPQYSYGINGNYTTTSGGDDIVFHVVARC
jgi:hypothetical protein